MSVNRNRAKLNKAENNRDYNLIYKHYMNDYCFICSKRSGSFYVSCSPADMHHKGRHGNRRPIYRHKFREYKTWKHNRKTKWKEKNLILNKEEIII